MREDLKSVGTMAAAMHYYAFLNDQDVVENIYTLPSVITDPKYVEIPTNDQSLIGKKYNRTTGKFEDIMFYYAILDAKDIVTQVVALESKVTDPKKIEVTSYDQSLVGKWYNRSNGTFTAPPIHILAKMSTGEINTLKADGTPEDKWLNAELNELRSKITQVENGTPEVKSLHTELAQLRSKITEVERGNFGGYKAKFKLKDNQMMTEAWVDNGKRLTFTFDTGISGYFPKMIRLADDGIENYFVADFYIVRNTDGTIKSAYMDQDYIGFMPINISDVQGRVVKHNVYMEDESAFSSEYSSKEGKMYNYGGFYFTGTPYKKQNSRVDIGQFSYNENSFSFTIKPSDTMVGQYTNVGFTGYVY